MPAPIAIRGAACHFPSGRLTIEQAFADEGLELTQEVRDRLDIHQVAVRAGGSGASLALAAARDALDAASVDAGTLDVVVDYTALPQDYLAPAWNMSNQLQHELEAKNAFTLGFAGAGASTLQVALDFTASLLATDDSVSTALLLASDCAIPGNRVLHPSDPVTLLGDGASALVLQRVDPPGEGEEPAEAPSLGTLLATALSSAGSAHDACYIRGGAMAYPLRDDLYRIELDADSYRGALEGTSLAEVAAQARSRAGVGEDGARLVGTNISARDEAAVADRIGASPSSASAANRREHGHVQSTDLVLNLLAAREEAEPGEHLLLASHGMGFTAGATIVRT